MLRIIASQIGHRDINTVGLYRTFLPCLQCVRWKRRPYVRKPLYLGTAKSKLLKFPQWHPYGPGEFEELHKLYNDYKHAFKSIWYVIVMWFVLNWIQ